MVSSTGVSTRSRLIHIAYATMYGKRENRKKEKKYMHFAYVSTFHAVVVAAHRRTEQNSKKKKQYASADDVIK